MDIKKGDILLTSSMVGRNSDHLHKIKVMYVEDNKIYIKVICDDCCTQGLTSYMNKIEAERYIEPFDTFKCFVKG